MPTTNMLGRFRPGHLVATPAVLEVVPRNELMNAFYRHLRCDWGDTCDHDRNLNNQALLTGDRLFSVYHSANDIKFWIITESDLFMVNLKLCKRAPHEQIVNKRKSSRIWLNHLFTTDSIYYGFVSIMRVSTHGALAINMNL